MLIRLSFNSKKIEEMFDVTEILKEEVKKSGIQNGVAHLYTPHTTCSVVVTEKTDAAFKYDFITVLKKILSDYQFKHMGGNGEAHLKSALMGVQQSFIISEGQVILGQWQGVYFIDFDGPRKREVLLKIQAG